LSIDLLAPPRLQPLGMQSKLPASSPARLKRSGSGSNTANADHSGRLDCPEIPAATLLSTAATRLATLENMKASSWRIHPSNHSTSALESTSDRSRMTNVALRIAAVLIFLIGAAVLVFGEDVTDLSGQPKRPGHNYAPPSPRIGRHRAGDPSNRLSASGLAYERGIILCPVTVGISGANRDCRSGAA